MNRSSLLGRFLKQQALGQIMPDGVSEAQGGETVSPTTPTPEPSGWDFAASMGKDFANSALPGIFNGQGGFDPMNALKQNTYGPYFGQNGIFNVTQNGPWRRK